MPGIKNRPLVANICVAVGLLCLAWPAVQWFTPSLAEEIVRHRFRLAEPMSVHVKLRWIGFLSVLPFTLTLATCMWTLRGYFLSARTGDDFTEEAAPLLRRAGLLMIAAGPLLWLGRRVRDTLMGQELGQSYQGWTVNLLVGAVFLMTFGAVLLSCAKMAERGRAMREEIEGFI